MCLCEEVRGGLMVRITHVCFPAAVLVSSLRVFFSEIQNWGKRGGDPSQDTVSAEPIHLNRVRLSVCSTFG